MREILINAYLDYINNYCSYVTWAEHQGMTPQHSHDLLELARKVYMEEHPDA